MTDATASNTSKINVDLMTLQDGETQTFCKDSVMQKCVHLYQATAVHYTDPAAEEAALCCTVCLSVCLSVFSSYSHTTG
jgi:hypothetical protein